MHGYRTIYRDIAPKGVLLDGTLSYARGRVGAAGIVTLDVLKEGALEVVKSLAIDKLRPGVELMLENAVAGFVILNGERPVSDGGDDSDDDRMKAALFETRVAAPWRDAFDDWLIAQIGSDLARAIGPSCMGEHFTDSDVDDAGVRSKVAIEMATRLAEAAMPMDTSDPNNVKPSVNKTLSAAGIVDSDLLPHTSAQAGPVATVEREKETMTIIDEPTARARVEQVVQVFALRTGADDFDPILLGELLGSAFDEDEFISLGAVERMGGTKDDVSSFRSYLMHAPLEVHGNTIAAAMAALSSGQVVEPPKPVKAKKIKVQAPSGGPPSTPLPTAPPPLAPPGPVNSPTPPAPGGASTPSKAVGDGDYGDVVKLWREHGKDNDESIGRHIGVSRAQVSNIGAGKVKCPLTPAQRQEIQAALNVKIAGLMNARDLLG